MPGQGLDAVTVEVLRRWGGGLRADDRGEVAAAGRAILLLIEEIERLHVLLWDKTLYPEAPVPGASGPEPARGGNAYVFSAGPSTKGTKASR